MTTKAAYSVDVLGSEVFVVTDANRNHPMKLIQTAVEISSGLELVTAIGSDVFDPKRELLHHVVDEVERRGRVESHERSNCKGFAKVV